MEFSWKQAVKKGLTKLIQLAVSSGLGYLATQGFNLPPEQMKIAEAAITTTATGAIFTGLEVGRNYAKVKLGITWL